ncbi:Ribonuclease 3 [anaerobic digester metagenome]|nr:ribonuclease III domain-containing protein [Methanoculleus sp.]
MEDSLEAKINYQFKNTDLLQRALLHRSRANEERQKQKVCKDQDALRTLGDAVLKTILCDLLMRSGYETKGEITIMKSTIESRPFLAELGRGFGLQNEILVGEGARVQKHNEEPNVIAETLEAIIGAMYLDGGYESAKKAVSVWYEPYREEMLKE